METKKIPATVITGFLGAGKTTLIRNMLQTANGKRIALIINEFGDLGVDGEVFKGCGLSECDESDIVELNNGCICCTVADDFVPTINALLEREERPDHIVIETSGLALPQPLVNAFNWPEIKGHVTVDGVVTVIDSHAVSEGRFAHDEEKLDEQRRQDEALDHESPLEELFEDQVNCADMIVLNKTDLVDDKVLDQMEDRLAGNISRRVKMVRSRHGGLSAQVLLGLDAATETQIHLRPTHHEAEHHGEENEMNGDHHHEHDHDEFVSFAVRGSAVSDRDKLANELKALIEAHDILRLKGFVHVEGKPMRLVVQAVGNRIDHYFDREWAEGEIKASQLVVIGFEGLDETGISAQIKTILS